MAQRAASICRECGRTVPSGGPYCEVHVANNRERRAARERESRRRAEQLKRLYDSPQWRRRTQPYILARDPLCKIAIRCEGRDASRHADHRIRAEIYIELHGGDESYFYDEDNLQGACAACHGYKTALEDAGRWDALQAEMGSRRDQ